MRRSNEKISETTKSCHIVACQPSALLGREGHSSTATTSRPLANIHTTPGYLLHENRTSIRNIEINAHIHTQRDCN